MQKWYIPHPNTLLPITPTPFFLSSTHKLLLFVSDFHQSMEHNFSQHSLSPDFSSFDQSLRLMSQSSQSSQFSQFSQFMSQSLQLSQNLESEDPSPDSEKDKRPAFKLEDDYKLTLAYLAVTEDPIHGAERKREIYWKGVSNHYNKVLGGSPPRTPLSLQNRWKRFLHLALQRMAGIVSKVETLCRSGYNQQDKVWI